MRANDAIGMELKGSLRRYTEFKRSNWG